MGKAPAIRQNPGKGITDVVSGMTRAWNSGDGADFASYFAEDGDLVTIHGMRVRGRAAIAGLYDLLLRTVFRRSRIEGEIRGIRSLSAGAMLLHMRIGVRIPGGVMAGEHDTVTSMVLKRVNARWLIASLHNTLVSDGAGRPLPAVFG
jgi:uncharacterized protein (TIGR02246 family)